MDDNTLGALCVWDEARGEEQDGRAAVARVIKNRMRLKYESDGTVYGTVLRYHQFSGFWFTMQNGEYTPIAFDEDEAEIQARLLLTQAQRMLVWQDCLDAWSEVVAGTYEGEDYAHLTDDTVLYLNPGIVKTLPVWATPETFVTRIGHHDFYRAKPSLSQPATTTA